MFSAYWVNNGSQGGCSDVLHLKYCGRKKWIKGGLIGYKLLKFASFFDRLDINGREPAKNLSICYETQQLLEYSKAVLSLILVTKVRYIR